MQQKRSIHEMSKDEILYRLLKKECGYYRAILDITEEENDKFNARRPLPEITPLMKKKKILLSCIREIDSALSPLKTYWRQQNTHDGPFAAKVQRELTLLEKLLHEILELDDANNRMLKDLLSKIKQHSASV